MYGIKKATEGRRLMAIVAVIALALCVCAVAIPSESDGATNVATVDELKSAITNAESGDTIILTAETYGSADDCTMYQIDSKALTIKAGSGVTPTVYGGFVVFNANGIVFDGIEICPDGEGQTMKTGIVAYTSDITIQNCTFTLNTQNLANGIMLYPSSSTVKYTITNNTFNGFAIMNDSDYLSCAIGFAANCGLTFGTGNYFTGIDAANSITSAMIDSEVLTALEIKLATSNTFSNCAYNVGYDDWTASTGTYVPGKLDNEVLASGTLANGYTNIIVPGQSITVSEDLTIEGELIVQGTLTVAEGKTFTANDMKIETGAIVNLYGSLEGTSVNNYGTIRILSSDASYPLGMKGSGTIDTSAVSSEAGLRGELKTDSVFTEQQIVTVDGNLTLIKGTQLVIKGTLVIPEGITVTIQEGAQLIILGQAAKVENNGTIVVESLGEDVTDGQAGIAGYNGGLVIDGGNFVNNGSLSAQYLKENVDDPTQNLVVISKGAVVENNGTITIGAEAGISILGIVKNNDTFTLLGQMSGGNDDTAEIENAGTVSINGQTSTAFDIVLTSTDAVVDIVNLKTPASNGSLRINNSGITGTNNSITGSTGGVNLSVGGTNSISGLTVTGTTVTEGKTTLKAITMSGTPALGTTAESGTASGIMIVYGIVLVNEDLTLPAGLTINMGGSSGALDLRVDSTMVINGTISTSGIHTGSELSVNGLLQTIVDITGTNYGNLTVNAVKYVTQAVSATDRTIYNYTTLESAVASGNTSIYAYGQIEVTSDVTVPNGTTLTQYAGNGTGKITVGENANLTFATGSRFIQNGTFTPATSEEYYGVDVEGTLYVEDVRNTLRSADTMAIYSEVRSSTGNDAMYTSLINAMDAAVEDSNTVIELYNKAVSIDRTTFTIKSGVTVDTNDQDFKINGSTLIINGTLFIDGGDYTVTDENSTGYTYEGSVTLNGYIKSATEFSYNGNEYPAGAYYSVTSSGIPMYYATTVDNAAAIISDVDNNTINICGTLDIGDVSFSGTTDETAYVNIANNANITAGTITIDEVRITIGDATFVGTIANADGSVEFAKNTAISSGAYVEDATTDDGNRLTLVAMTSKGTDGEGNVVVDGTVYIGAGSNIYAMTVDGTAQVTSNGVRAEIITINGTLNVAANASFIATTAYVTGTLSTAVSTAETPGQGTATVQNLYVGLTVVDGKIVDGTAGTVSGNVTLTATPAGTAYVSSGSTIPESFADMQYTEFFVDNTLWLTAYGTTANVSNAPVSDAKFIGWKNADGETVYYATPGNGQTGTSDIAIGAYDGKLYADIDYNVYDVIIIVDSSIGSVAIDGQMLVRDPFTGAYTTVEPLSAGTHNVTYTLKSGYEGEATLSSSTVTIDGSNFTLSGDYEGVTYYLSLGGATPISGSTSSGSSDDGLGLTDILLIILVVLIVIMAIMVAMRLMRS